MPSLFALVVVMPMPKPVALVRAFLEPAGSTAELCLVIQFPQQAGTVWQWDFPYVLWQAWGLSATATWLAEQFRRHDSATFNAVGSRALLQALRHGLQRHQHYYGPAWLPTGPA